MAAAARVFVGVVVLGETRPVVAWLVRAAVTEVAVVFAVELVVIKVALLLVAGFVVL